MNCIATLTAVLFCIAATQVTQQESPSARQHLMVTVPFFADGGHGNSVVTITQADLSILDNKKPPESIVAIRTPKQMPLRLGILIDTSNSERRSELYRPGAEAIPEFMNEVLDGPEDRAFLMGFDMVPQGTGFLKKDELPKFKIDLTPSGGTAMFDAIYLACDDRMRKDPAQPARRVLVIVTDGGDNMSHVNQDKAIAAAQETETVIFAVSTSENPNGNLDSGRLEKFADKTGGRAYLHLSRKQIPKVFADIREQIGAMYAVSYVPADLAQAGQYRSLELKMKSDMKMKLRTAKGYYAAAAVPVGSPP